MVKLDKALQLANLSNLLGKIKTYVDNLVQEHTTAVAEVIDTLETDILKKGNCEILTFSNVAVATSAWTSDTTVSGYPYKAAVTCQGVTADFIPEVVFSVGEATSGKYATVSESGTDVVYIFSTEKPTEEVVLSTIKCLKAVG